MKNDRKYIFHNWFLNSCFTENLVEFLIQFNYTSDARENKGINEKNLTALNVR